MKISFWVALLIVLAGFVIWKSSPHNMVFSANRLEDRGIFSYPRYRADVASIPLWKDAAYKFRIQGLPTEAFSLALDVDPGSQADRAILEKVQTRVSVLIQDDEANTLCQASGNFSDAQYGHLDGWALASSQNRAYFWHRGCRDVPVKSGHAYWLSIKLVGSDGTPRRNLNLVLTGGGNELP